MADRSELLERYKPHLRYDSQEDYFADSAAIWTDSPGNVLTDAKGGVIAAAQPEGNQAKLSLSFLARDKYANGADADPEHRIGHRDRDYRDRYRELHTQARYRNRMYGHAVEGAANLWLQYWFFYYYNPSPSPIPIVKYGAHEGDWEMIALRLDDNDRPNLAAYAQHSHAGIREWPDVEKIGSDTPVVYVAKSSHASYFQTGRYHMGIDRANGKRDASHYVLEIVEDELPAWVAWPGRWGDTLDPEGLEPGENSPEGPYDHGQWTAPDVMIPKDERTAAPKVDRPPVVPPDLQQVAPKRAAGGLEVAYEFPPGTPEAQRVVLVTVNSPDDDLPPATFEIETEDPSGAVVPDVALDDEKRYEIQVSAASENGVLTQALERWLDPVA